MNRTTTRYNGDRTAMGISRAVVDSINDSPFMQTMGAKIMGDEQSTDIEHVHPFGMTAFPMGKTTDEQAKGGMMKGAAEVLIMGLMGNRSHPMAMPAADRRFRLNGLQAGETGFHDAFKQYLHMGKDSMMAESPKRVVHRVAAEKQQGSQGSGSGQQKKNNGADVTAEKDVKVSVTMDKDGSYAVDAKGAGTITCKTLVLSAGGCTITMKDGKIILDGDVYVGGSDGAKKIATEDTRDSLGGKLQEPFARKAKAK
ncbi:phage baseplate assembly protein domain-containing protein [Methylobacterium soli]|uniref:Bacteriophage Mu Gp45 N-terminal domain-containing protein n=1 Tax=Methylobacterium soli TaxID=553447 RepID=A0A6L3T3A0_9HYPH|nr:phage baseplate assembly protein [Methylobacterium soli]KAB1079412.1 hypothetical protein F6X53_11455 [Methylobacterium soli]GJE45373.1 hypothetical protein AEGHOMDF_4567 [Methylobacterium soli]